MNTENLKKARKNKSMTQKEVADKIGVGQSTYKNYECGQREPNGDTIVALANLFDVSTDYLLGKPEAQPPANPIDEFVDKTKMKVQEQAALKKWLALDEKKRKMVLDVMSEIVHEYEAEECKSQKDESNCITVRISLDELEEKQNHQSETLQNTNTPIVKRYQTAARSSNNTPIQEEVLTEEQINSIRNGRKVPRDL